MPPRPGTRPSRPRSRADPADGRGRDRIASPIFRRAHGLAARHALPRTAAFGPVRPGPEPSCFETLMTAPAPKVSFVSLGCPKALVDSERIVTQLRAQGYELSRRHDGADVVVVNTCGFLDSAKAESLEAIGAAMAENGKVIVTGCMGAEPEPIRARFPGVLAVTGPQQYESVVAAVHAAAPPVANPLV